MAIFESRFNVGDKIFHLESLVRWANGAAKSIKLHEVKVVETSTKATENGTETVARRMDAAVVYWDMQKPSRGHYHIDIRLITDAPTKLPPDAITHRYKRPSGPAPAIVPPTEPDPAPGS